MRNIREKRIVIAAIFPAVLLTACGTAPKDPLEHHRTVTAVSQVSQTAVSQDGDTIQWNENAMDFRLLFDQEHSMIPCKADGVVYGAESITMYEAANSDSRQLIRLPEGAQVKVTAMTVQGNIYNAADRWLKIRANGHEGYVPSEHIALQCSTPQKEMNMREKAVLGVLMYYQSLSLYDLYTAGGGLQAKGFAEEYDKEQRQKLLPEELTVSQIRQGFHLYFSSRFEDIFDTVYARHDGALWVSKGAGEKQRQEMDICCLTAQGNGCIYYETRTAEQKENPRQNAGAKEWQKAAFVIAYENGIWKTSELYTGK